MREAVCDFSCRSQTDQLAAWVSENKENDDALYMCLLIMKMLEVHNPKIQSELGDCYYQGRGVVSNIDKALNMFKKAANKGSVRAQYDLGWYYYDKYEYIRAVDYFLFCLSHRAEFEERQIGACYECLGDSYTRLPEPKVTLGIENLMIAADKYNRSYACRRLSEIYEREENFNANMSFVYLQKAARLEDEIAISELAMNYIWGNEKLKIEINRRKAEELLLANAGKNNARILSTLGYLYQRDDHEKGFFRDIEKSKYYYEKSWELEKNQNVASSLGYTYYLKSEWENAKKMFVFAAEHGNYDYSDFLARIYKDGVCNEKNINKAVYYYEQSYISGNINNVFTCAEYTELLDETGDYKKAYEIAEYGKERFNDIWFVFLMAKLILDGKVTNKASQEEASRMMEACINYEVHQKEANVALSEYYLKKGEYRKAVQCLINATDFGDSESAFILARIYEQGAGTIKPNIDSAYEWYKKAAELGNEKGKRELECFRKGLFGGYKRVRSL